ncbi:hypothetical protein [Paenibacillus curdlanolyticus]|nr:hypothetical protein [Paenibacillus curdlanolyticus]
MAAEKQRAEDVQLLALIESVTDYMAAVGWRAGGRIGNKNVPYSVG